MGILNDVCQRLSVHVAFRLVGDEPRRTLGEDERVASDVRCDQNVRQGPLGAVGGQWLDIGLRLCADLFADQLSVGAESIHSLSWYRQRSLART